MLFPTIDFALFFGVVYVGAWLLNRQVVAWKLFMLAASYFFYAWWDWRFCGLLALSTLVAFLGAEGVHRASTDARRRGWLTGSLVGLLGLLGWFKYYGFFAVSADNVLHSVGLGAAVPLLTPTLPIAISFFTFMAVSYVVDVYRRQLEPARPLDVAVYLSFFPHLVAGPIVRGSELLPQLRHPRDADRVDLARAATLIVFGLFKKMVVSAYVGTAIVKPVFDSPGTHSAPEVLLAVWGFAVQIYADFSGYTDIAIGIALLLGVRFPVNFDAPYTARDLQDFWRRWHVTLSRWLRDYLYIPLGGSRGGELATARNLMVTMVLGGLWHGANWTFLAWGALHGAGQVVGHRRRTERLARGEAPLDDRPWSKVSQRFWTFQFVCLGWLFFRATSMSNAFEMLGRLFTGWRQPSPLITPLLVLVVAVSIAAQYVPSRVIEDAVAWFRRVAAPLQAVALALALLTITTLSPPGVTPFIYYRF
jgi:alginate O-acetyltransferase complex protein AlgI